MPGRGGGAHEAAAAAGGPGAARGARGALHPRAQMVASAHRPLTLVSHGVADGCKCSQTSHSRES